MTGFPSLEKEWLGVVGHGTAPKPFKNKSPLLFSGEGFKLTYSGINYAPSILS